MRTLLLAIVLMMQGAAGPPGGAISGRLLTMDGTPAAGVSVGAFGLLDDQPGQRLSLQTIVETGRDGSYRFKKLPAGRYIIGAGLMDRPNYFPGVTEQGSASMITLNDSADLGGIDFPAIQSPALVVEGREITDVYKSIYLPGASWGQLSEILTALRTRLNARSLTIFAGGILMRDTPQRIGFAAKLIAEFNPIGEVAPTASTLGSDAAGHLFVLDKDTVQNVTPSRLQLQLRVAGPLSFDLKETTRGVFEKLAEAGGLNVIFDPQFATGPTTVFKVDNIDVLGALDLLAQKTKNFWQVWDSSTIVVAADNTASRQALEPYILKTIYLKNAETPARMLEIMVSLRNIMNMRYVASSSYVKAIVIKETPSRLTIAEKIISDLDMPSSAVLGEAPVPTAVMLLPGDKLPPRKLVLLNGDTPRNVSPSRSQLRMETPGPQAIQLKGSARSSFEKLGEIAGLQVQFDRAFVDGTNGNLHLSNVGILDALDLLALQSGNLWQATNSDTILVTPDSPKARLAMEPEVSKTFYLKKVTTAEELTEIVTVLRTILNLRVVDSDESTNSIVMTATPAMIALSEKIIADLDRPKR